MPKPKKSALRGPKLFGKLGPVQHDQNRTEWRSVRGLVYVEKVNQRWAYFFLGREHGGFESRAIAKRSLQREIASYGSFCAALGWEPK